MARPADLPYTDHFQEMPCGTRAKYVSARCRCAECRGANRRYAQQREAAAKAAASSARSSIERGEQSHRACVGVNGQPCQYRSRLRKDSIGEVCCRCRFKLTDVWNGLVSTDAVRAHLRRLSRQNIGYKSVAIAADVSKSVLADIMAGRQQQMRAQASRRVLAIDRDAVADHALVPAGQTWRRLQRLLLEGFTKTELARRLGSRAIMPALQFKHHRICAKTATKVERFYKIVMVA